VRNSVVPAAAMNSSIDFSSIICSHRPDRASAAHAHFEQLFSGRAFEIIMIADAVSLCEGYSRGFARSVGRFIVFSHDDIELVTASMPEQLAAYLEAFDVIGVAGTTLLINGAWISAGDPHAFASFAYPDAEEGRVLVKVCGRGGMVIAPVQALDGCFKAATRSAVKQIGFDASTFDGFHLYNLDFSYRAHLRGLNVALCRDLLPIHASTGKADQHWRKYRERFENKFSAQLAAAANGSRGVKESQEPEELEDPQPPQQTKPTRVVQVRLARNSLAAFIAEGGCERLMAALR
jgi:hypothetical protein